jgi:hypothetical protein
MIGNFLAVSTEKLESLIDDPDQITSLLYPEDDYAVLPNYLDIDKAWHAIHFTLNGKAWEGESPLFDVILGGEEIGEDIGYGPARYLTSAKVKSVAATLACITPEKFKEQFNPKALDAAQIYPEIWVRDGEEGLEYVLDYYKQLQSFYQAAAERGDAALLYIN